MSQIGILTPDWSIAAVPCYSPEWKIAFGVNDEANKIRVCSKVTSWNNFLFENVINNDILQLCLEKISLYQIKNNWNKTTFSALHEKFHSSNAVCVCQIQQLRPTEFG